MGYPDKEHFAKQHAEFLRNGGPERVQRHLTGMTSIVKHKESGEPWPAFHRCSVCGEHPEAQGERCLTLGLWQEMKICEYCVKKLYETMMAVPV